MHFSIPLDCATKNGYTATFDPDRYVTLFRRVSNSRRDFYLVKAETAVPLPGGANAIEHCNGNLDSNHTSWTFNPWIAISFATDEGRNSGIVLIKVFKYSEIISRYSDIC